MLDIILPAIKKQILKSEVNTKENKKMISRYKRQSFATKVFDFGYIKKVISELEFLVPKTYLFSN
ncbi:MAG: hypothetical protein F6K22_24420 [Okeania sp. SIO2F4]|uniref:hypothetical protein n=1 Tax=Okeania sp. SIO2F4 TaxID=2607790 RepID=UPI00142A5186|nr:hypothetical protein [Okeania sp. SIO2F4]NES05677.1 hypothetical protein [Okeania sp. SIO2F4]